MENQINVGEPNTQKVGQKPDSQPTNIQNNPRVNYWMISAILILFLIVSGFTYFTRIRLSTSPVSLQSESTEVNSSSILSNPITLDTFYIQASATLRLTDSGYTLEEEFSPVFDDEEDKDYFSSVIKAQQSKKTICKIEKVSVDGQKEIYYTTALYTADEDYSPSKDTCLTLEAPMNKTRLLNPVLIPVGPDTKEFNFHIGESLVKSIPRKANNFRIVSLNKVPRTQLVNFIPVQGFDIRWNVETDDEDEIGIALQIRKGDEKWSTAAAGSYKTSKSYFFIPSDSYYKAKTGKLDVRLMATNGFYTSIWEEKDFIRLTNETNGQ